ncbi:MAG: acyl carrier protein [Pseudodesulfovibrio sp.]|nr:acyl carrier protein [Pseudodesulfovibrio sp.]
MSLKDKIKKTLVQELDLIDINPNEINDKDPLFGDEGLGLDSLDAVEIVVLVQKFFNAEIKDIEEGKIALQSVNSLAKFIEEKQ